MASIIDIEQKKGRICGCAIGSIGALLGIWATAAFILYAFTAHVSRFEYSIAVVFPGLYPLLYKVINNFLGRKAFIAVSLHAGGVSAVVPRQLEVTGQEYAG